MTASELVLLLDRAGGSRELSRLSGVDRRNLQRMAKGEIEIRTNQAAKLKAAREAITARHAAALASAFGRVAA